MRGDYLIIPGCSDLNRGDQSLVWETKRLAEDSGYTGTCYLISEINEPTVQSENRGIKIISPILEHPSRKSSNKNNISYGRIVKFKWGVVAILDFLFSLSLLWKYTRKVSIKMLGKEKRKTFAIFNEVDAVFMKGGGLLQTYGGIVSTYSMYFWVYHIFLADVLGKNVYVLPNSFGPFDGPFVKSIVKYALNKCKLIYARESLSQQMLKNELGFNVTVKPDLAFFMSTQKYDNCEKKKFIKKHNIPLNKKIVAITIRPYRFPTSTDPINAYVKFKKEMAKFIDKIINSEFYPLVVEHTLAVNSHENDGSCIKEVMEMVKSKDYTIISNANYNCYDLKKIYGYCDFIVGTRFHSVIFSLSQYIPAIAISYIGNKTMGIMKDIGLEEYVIDIEEVSCNRLLEMFDKMKNNRMLIIEKIQKYALNFEVARNEMVNQIQKSGGLLDEEIKK